MKYICRKCAATGNSENGLHWELTWKEGMLCPGCSAIHHAEAKKKARTNCMNALKCMYLEVPEKVGDDIHEKVMTYILLLEKEVV